MKVAHLARTAELLNSSAGRCTAAGLSGCTLLQAAIFQAAAMMPPMEARVLLVSVLLPQPPCRLAAFRRADFDGLGRRRAAGEDGGVAEVVAQRVVLAARKGGATQIPIL